MIRPPPTSTLFPYTTLFRSSRVNPRSVRLLKDEVCGLRSLRPIRSVSWNNRSTMRSEEHTSELQSHSDLVCRLLLEKKKKPTNTYTIKSNAKVSQEKETDS